MDGYFAMPNPDSSPGQPRYMVREQTGLSSYTPGGLIKTGSLKELILVMVAQSIS